MGESRRAAQRYWVGTYECQHHARPSHTIPIYSRRLFAAAPVVVAVAWFTERPQPMVVVEWVTAVVVAIAMGGAGVMKITGPQAAREMAQRLGYEGIRLPLGLAELAGATGVVVGAASTDLEWLGILAAAGIVAVLIGALVFHRRVGDTSELVPPLVVLACGVVYIVAITLD